MNLLHPVSKLMSKNLITLVATDSIATAGDMFNKHKIHHIPILEGEKLIGIVSKSDYLFFRKGFLNNKEDFRLEEIRMNNYEVSYIMTKGIAKLNPTDKINVALEIFKKNIFHAIPIISNEKLVGILTTYDIILQLSKDKSTYSEYEMS